MNEMLKGNNKHASTSLSLVFKIVSLTVLFVNFLMFINKILNHMKFLLEFPPTEFLECI